jgi:hypothetical protein
MRTGRPALRSFATALLLVSVSCTASVTESEVPLAWNFRIDAVVGGHKGRFLFDTGFTATTIGAEAAGRWRLEEVQGPEFEVTDASGIARKFQRHVRVPELAIGATSYSAFDAPVIDFPPSLDVAGVLGMNAMQTMAWIVDVQAQRLCVLNAANLERRLHELYPTATWTVVPLRHDGTGWGVPVELEGKGRVQAILKLDTGAGTTSLPAALVQELDLPDGTAEVRRQDAANAEALRRAAEEKGLQVRSVKFETGTGELSLFGETSRPWYLLGALRLGRAECQSRTVHASGERHGLLGADVLRRIVWALDGPGSRLLVRDP